MFSWIHEFTWIRTVHQIYLQDLVGGSLDEDGAKHKPYEQIIEVFLVTTAGIVAAVFVQHKLEGIIKISPEKII